MALQPGTRLGPYEIAAQIGLVKPRLWSNLFDREVMLSPRAMLVALSVLIAGCSAPDLATVSAADPSPANVIFRDVSVFDGTALLEHQDVLVTDAEIQAVSPTGQSPLLPTALEIDGTGRTLLPGLIDSHMHLFSAGGKEVRPPPPEPIAHAFLFAGVTSVLVAAGFGEVGALKEASLRGETLAPRLFTAGSGLTAPGGHPISLLRATLPWPISPDFQFGCGTFAHPIIHHALIVAGFAREPGPRRVTPSG